MKEIATFMAESGDKVAIISESVDGSLFRVNYGTQQIKSTKFFHTEEEATDFATNFAFPDNKPKLLKE